MVGVHTRKSKTSTIDSKAASSPARIHFFHWYDYLALAVSFVFLLIFFSHGGDIYHTAESSMAYLRGHILDFYDYNKVKMDGDDYYPFLYLIFALWNVPMKLSGIQHLLLDSHPEIIYEKLLPTLFYILTSVPVYLIIRKIGKSAKTAMFGVFLLLTTGCATIPIICWGMYDIILTFFILFGIYFMIRDVSRWDMWIAMLLCGLGFATKPYGIIVFLPILAYRCKKLYQAVGYGCLSMIPILVSRLIYRGSPAFNGQAKDSSDFINRLFFVNIDNSFFKTSIFLLALFSLIMIAYGMEYDPAHKIKMIYWALPAGAIFYGLVLWHPQWLTLIVPFLCITTAVSTKRNVYMLYETVISIFFTVHTFTQWGQFDVGLVMSSHFGKYLSAHPSAFFLKHYFPPQYAGAYSAMIVAVLIATCVLKNPFHDASQYDAGAEITGQEKAYAYLRFIVGVGFYAGTAFVWFLMNLKH